MLMLLAASLATWSGRPLDLFDGQSLAGWEKVGGGIARVERGRLILEHDADRRPGYLLATLPPLRDVEVEVECRIWQGDTGLFFRAEQHPMHAEEVQGPQVQLNLARGRGLGGIFEHHGRGWLARPGRELALDPSLPVRVWLRARGDHIQVRVNGQSTVDIRDGGAENHFLRPGQVALQIHGGGSLRAEFSRICLVPLPLDLSEGLNALVRVR